MTELAVPLTAGLVAYASKDMIAKLLGPTFDYVGGGLKNFVEKRHSNVISIFAKAGKKLGDKINEDGAVNPRVLKHILDEGSFCEDELTQEYFAGLMASSRIDSNDTVNGNDETLPYLSIVEKMSARNILFHYMLYYSFVMKVFREKDINLFETKNIKNRKVCFPRSTLHQLLGESNLGVMISDICTHANKEILIGGYRFGKFSESEKNPDTSIPPEMQYLRVNPTLFGLTLFLKASAAPKNILSLYADKTAWIDNLENEVSIDPMPITL
ncbi:MAG: hypothetical protein FWE74_07690 [Oscillospiraceae bacterium]|nr:hypothetical protein [Oscillospiraceae bacterium]